MRRRGSGVEFECRLVPSLNRQSPIERKACEESVSEKVDASKGTPVAAQTAKPLVFGSNLHFQVKEGEVSLEDLEPVTALRVFALREAASNRRIDESASEDGFSSAL